MFIHYDNITNRVTGYVDFIAGVPEVWNEPTVEVTEFTFLHPHTEYEIQNGIPVHVGKSQEMLDAEAQAKQKLIENGVQAHLDLKAKEHGYDSILSACSYAGYPNPYETEGKSFIVWRGNVWAYCYQELAKVQDGTRTEPTLEEFLLELPIYEEIVI